MQSIQSQTFQQTCVLHQAKERYQQASGGVTERTRVLAEVSEQITFLPVHLHLDQDPPRFGGRNVWSLTLCVRTLRSLFSNISPVFSGQLHFVLSEHLVSCGGNLPPHLGSLRFDAPVFCVSDQ